MRELCENVDVEGIDTCIVCEVSQTLLFKEHTAYDVCKTFYYYRTQCMCETRISVSYI